MPQNLYSPSVTKPNHSNINLQVSNSTPNKQLISFDDIFDFCKENFFSLNSFFFMKSVEDGFLLNI